MSAPAAVETDDRSRADVVAGFLAAFAIFLSAVAIAYRPFRLAPIAAVIALVAAAMAGRRSNRLTQVAVAAAFVGWLAGMIVAVVTDAELF